MKKYLMIITTLIQGINGSCENDVQETDEIQIISNEDEILFYKNLLKNYFNKLPRNIIIYFSYGDQDTNDNTEQNTGTIHINKALKTIKISNNIFHIYNEGDKFHLIDIELNEPILIKKPEIVDLFLNDNIDFILKDAKFFKKNNRLSCKIEIKDSIGSSTIILSFNIIKINNNTQLDLKFWNIKNEYMKNKTIKIKRIEEKI